MLKGEPVVDHPIHAPAHRVLVSVHHLDRIEVPREPGPPRAIPARVELTDVEVADLAVDARVVDVDDGVRRVLAHVLEEVVGAPAMHQHRALSRLLEIRRQRERPEVPPARRGQLVPHRARDVATGVEGADEGLVVRHHVVVGRHDHLHPVGHELVDPILHRHVRIG
jgi:hypothetical protein